MILCSLLGIFLIICIVWAILLLKKILHFDSTDLPPQLNGRDTGQWCPPSQKCLTENLLQRLLPVGMTRSWRLDSVINSHRIWQFRSSSGAVFYSLTVRIKCSSQNLVGFIRRPDTFKLWRPRLSCCSTLSENSHRQVLKWKQKKLECRLLSQDNLISWWLEPFLEYDCMVSRVLLDGAKYSGLIENLESSGTSTAFVCQPIIGLENDQCRLTAVTSGDIHRLTEECQCLLDHFAMMRAPVHLTPATSNDEPAEGKSNNITDMNNSNGETVSLAQCPDVVVTPAGEEEAHDGSNSEERISLDPAAESGGTLNEALEEEKSTTLTDSTLRPDAKQRSGQVERQDESEELPGREETVDGYSSVVFMRTISSENQPCLVDYKTLSNQCAADLLAEVLNATNVVQKPSRERAADAPALGWVFERTDRDVAVLQKYNPSQSCHSWLGKALIKSTPDLVYQTISNPYSRYIYDEMLKDLTVVCDLGNGMKLLRLFYSTSQVLRRDNREFYLLQAERTENNKKLLTLCSIVWPESEAKECPRGKFETSGWIVEPIVSKNKNVYSMVTYLSQLDLGDLSTSGVQQFEEEFVTKQPTAIAELRDYLINSATK